MSRRWTAKCWMGSKSGYVDMEVSASTLSGAKEQLQNIYGAQQIINLREVRGGGSGLSAPSGGGPLLLGILGAGALFMYFTPWVLMTLYGAVGTWASQKITGITMSEFGDIENPNDEEIKKGVIILLSTIILGGAGFIHGSLWNADLNKEYNLDGKQSQVEEVRKK